jgi:hypothetical protein
MQLDVYAAAYYINDKGSRNMSNMNTCTFCAISSQVLFSAKLGGINYSHHLAVAYREGAADIRSHTDIPVAELARLALASVRLLKDDNGVPYFRLAEQTARGNATSVSDGDRIRAKNSAKLAEFW